MSDQVECAECGARYDSATDPFCPRCGSTAKGKPLAGALASARRADPSRRRVQAAGVVLTVVGALFLVSSLASLFIPSDAVAQQMRDSLADSPGGVVELNVSALQAPVAVRIVALHGQELQNGTTSNGTFVSDPLGRASVHVEAQGANGNWSRDAVVLVGDRLALDATAQPANATAPPVALSKTVQATLQASKGLGLAIAALLCAGGVATLRLRLWGLAATAALVAALLGLFALFLFLLAGLLFALPLGYVAFAILRGRRHFTR